MRKLLLLILLFSASVTWGQGLKFATQTWSQVAKGTRLPIGNFHFSLSKSFMHKIGPVTYNSLLRDQLSSLSFPITSPINDGLVVQQLQLIKKNVEEYERNFTDISRLIQNKTFKGYVPYHSYLPKDLEVLYLGEVHNRPLVEREFSEIIDQLPLAYPNRPIYVATEFLALKRTNLLPSSIITDRNALARATDEMGLAPMPVLERAVDKGIGVIGLEPEAQMSRKVGREIVGAHTYDADFAFATSAAGMRYRNYTWKKTIEQLRHMEPNALIVVYAGAGHVDYSSLFSLPAIIPQKSFVVFGSDAASLPLLNPFVSQAGVAPLGEDVIFNMTPELKVVETWKKDTPLKRIIGSDMSIIVHSEEADELLDAAVSGAAAAK